MNGGSNDGLARATYRLPSGAHRVAGGVARLVLLLVAVVGIPAVALEYASAHGVPLPVPLATVALGGTALAVLSSVAYALRPTRAFGPASMGASAAALVYLGVLIADATYRIVLPGSSIALTVGYVGLLGLLMLVPALSLASAVLITVEDAVRPGERLPFDFPP